MSSERGEAAIPPIYALAARYGLRVLENRRKAPPGNLVFVRRMNDGSWLVADPIRIGFFWASGPEGAPVDPEDAEAPLFAVRCLFGQVQRAVGLVLLGGSDAFDLYTAMLCGVVPKERSTSLDKEVVVHLREVFLRKLLDGCARDDTRDSYRTKWRIEGKEGWRG